MSKKVTLTTSEKILVLKELQAKSQSEVAKQFGITQSTVSRIKKNQATLIQDKVAGGNLERKRKRKSTHEEVDKAVAKWFHQQRTKNAVISGPMLMEQAQKMAITMDVDFTPSNGWLSRFKSRENITFTRICGEKASADFGDAQEWIESSIPDLIIEYDPKDVYNADESALYYRALPTGTLAADGDTPIGIKLLKQRITVLFICNMDGSDKHIYVIGKSAKPRCFRHVKNLPIPYFSNRKAWMTGEVWTKIVAQFEQMMRAQKQKNSFVLR